MWKQLEEKIIAFRDARDWAQFHTPKDVALSISLEAAELLEIFQWTRDADLEACLAEHKVHVGEELADICVLAITLAHDAGIDLPAAIEDKLEKNARKYPIELSRGRARPTKIGDEDA